jgi:peptide deformylase
MLFTKTLEIRQIGNPILRAIAEPITNAKDHDVQKLIDSLIKTLKQSKGVGIAAPQVGRSQRLLVIASHPNARYPNAPKMQPIALINPKIVAYSDKVEKDWEGCLSVPGIRGLVPRSDTVEVAYISRDGEPKNTVFTGFVARIFQHEYDHIEGKVFLDRVESTLDLVSEDEYLKLINQSD